MINAISATLAHQFEQDLTFLDAGGTQLLSDWEQEFSLYLIELVDFSVEIFVHTLQDYFSNRGITVAGEPLVEPATNPATFVLSFRSGSIVSTAELVGSTEPHLQFEHYNDILKIRFGHPERSALFQLALPTAALLTLAPSHQSGQIANDVIRAQRLQQIVIARIAFLKPIVLKTAFELLLKFDQRGLSLIEIEAGAEIPADIYQSLTGRGVGFELNDEPILSDADKTTESNGAAKDVESSLTLQTNYDDTGLSKKTLQEQVGIDSQLRPRLESIQLAKQCWRDDRKQFCAKLEHELIDLELQGPNKDGYHNFAQFPFIMHALQAGFGAANLWEFTTLVEYCAGFNTNVDGQQAVKAPRALKGIIASHGFSLIHSLLIAASQPLYYELDTHQRFTGLERAADNTQAIQLQLAAGQIRINGPYAGLIAKAFAIAFAYSATFRDELILTLRQEGSYQINVYINPQTYLGALAGYVFAGDTNRQTINASEPAESLVRLLICGFAHNYINSLIKVPSGIAAFMQRRNRALFIHACLAELRANDIGVTTLVPESDAVDALFVFSQAQEVYNENSEICAQLQAKFSHCYEALQQALANSPPQYEFAKQLLDTIDESSGMSSQLPKTTNQAATVVGDVEQFKANKSVNSINIDLSSFDIKSLMLQELLLESEHMCRYDNATIGIEMSAVDSEALINAPVFDCPWVDQTKVTGFLTYLLESDDPNAQESLQGSHRRLVEQATQLSRVNFEPI